MSINNKDDNLSFLENYKIFAFIALGIAILVYAFSKTGLGFTINSAGDMGAFGDFFGGVLNPTFTLLGFLALLATIRIQSKALQVSSDELVNSRKELELTREEISKSTIAQQEQSGSIKLQNFENTFFNMINLHNSSINNMVLVHQPFRQKQIPNITGTKLETIDYPQKYKICRKEINLNDDTDYKGKKALSKLLEILKSYQDIKKGEDDNEIYCDFYQEYIEIIGNYFNSIHQILKFIDNNKTQGNIEITETYTELFNSQFLPSELELLFFHCALTMNMKHETTRMYLEKFSFFEELSNNKNITQQMIDAYDKKAFGHNFSLKLNFKTT